jgi:hypothetical protein
MQLSLALAFVLFNGEFQQPSRNFIPGMVAFVALLVSGAQPAVTAAPEQGVENT